MILNYIHRTFLFLFRFMHTVYEPKIIRFIYTSYKLKCTKNISVHINYIKRIQIRFGCIWLICKNLSVYERLNRVDWDQGRMLFYNFVWFEVSTRMIMFVFIRFGEQFIVYYLVYCIAHHIAYCIALYCKLPCITYHNCISFALDCIA